MESAGILTGLISVGVSIIVNILIAAVIALPTSGPKELAYPAPNAPKSIAKIAINTS